MGFKYSIGGKGIYFITFTVVDWVDVFTRRIYKDILVDSLKFCQQHKGLDIYSWVIMTNHVHLIVSTSGKLSLSEILRDLKKFTSKALVKAIEENNESRKDWMLDRFEFKGRINPKIKNYQFWQEGSHPVELISNHFIKQKLIYIHNNPVEAGFVAEPEDYLYSSAIDYSGRKGMIDVIVIE
jgi:REP element-mobilizing transposase RayT